MAQVVEVPYEADMTPERFWQLARDLLYTKVYYDTARQEYYTRTLGNGTEAGGEDQLLGLCTEDEINTILVSYLTLVSNYTDQLDDYPEFYEKASNFLLDYDSYKQNRTFCLRKMLSLLVYAANSNEQNMSLNPDSLEPQLRDDVNLSISTNEKFIKIIGWVLYLGYCGPDRDSLLALLEEYGGKEAIIGVLNNYALISRNCDQDEDPYLRDYANYFALLYELCQDEELNLDQLNSIGWPLVKFLLSHLRSASQEDDPVNYLRYKLLLILNEQYMVYQYSHSEETVDNKVFDTLVNDDQLFQSFLPTLILNFNREEDPTIQILMLKILYLIFTTSRTCQSIYLNDLKVIVDIIIRELCNLSTSKDVPLINTYLRVLYPLLVFSNLKDKRYKVDSMRDILKYLDSSEQAPATTKRLAERCLDLDVFKEQPVQAQVPLPSPGPPSRPLAASLPTTPVHTGGSDSSGKLAPPPRPRPRHWSSADRVPAKRESASSTISEDEPYRMYPHGYSTDAESISSTDTISSRRSRGPAPPPPRRRGNSSELSLSRAKV